MTHEHAWAVRNAFGSTRYGDIIEGCCGTRHDFSNPAEAAKFVGAGGLRKCVNVVQTTVRLATGIPEDADGKGDVAPAQ